MACVDHLYTADEDYTKYSVRFRVFLTMVANQPIPTSYQQTEKVRTAFDISLDRLKFGVGTNTFGTNFEFQLGTELATQVFGPRQNELYFNVGSNYTGFNDRFCWNSTTILYGFKTCIHINL